MNLFRKLLDIFEDFREYKDVFDSDYNSLPRRFYGRIKKSNVFSGRAKTTQVIKANKLNADKLHGHLYKGSLNV